MGVTYLSARVRRPDGRGPWRDVRFLVDSGALYSVLPEEIWRALKLKPQRTAEFILADGTPLTRGVSECRFEIGGLAATSPVVLGEKDDGALLGAVTLETLGLMLNPLNREVVPMRLMLARLRAARACDRRHFYGPLPVGSLQACKSDRLLGPAATVILHGPLADGSLLTAKSDRP